MIDDSKYISKLQRFIKERKLEIEKIEPLTPDASTRRYFRLYLPNAKTLIVMVMGDIDRKIIFEEIIEKQINFQELPFINIGKFLRKKGINVPEIYMESKDVIALQDFGNTPLDVFVTHHGIEKALPYYTSAIDELVKMQRLEENKSCYAFEIRFSKNMFLWEFNHFTEYFMGFPLEKDKTMFHEFSEIAQTLSEARYVFTHRDFHSKNLMCLENYKVGILDFQDALLAPYVYDLVSLTADAYVDIPEEIETKIVNTYKEKMRDIIDNNFETLYNMCAVQRTLKAAGRFVYIFKEKKNPKFLPYVIPAALKGVKYMKKLGLKSASKVEEQIEKIKKELKTTQ